MTAISRRSATVLTATALGAVFCVTLASRKSRAAGAADPLISQQTFEGSRFVVCRYASDAQELRLAWAGADGKPLVNFKALEQSLARTPPASVSP